MESMFSRLHNYRAFLLKHGFDEPDPTSSSLEGRRLSLLGQSIAGMHDPCQLAGGYLIVCVSGCRDVGWMVKVSEMPARAQQMLTRGIVHCQHISSRRSNVPYRSKRPWSSNSKPLGLRQPLHPAT